MPPTFLYLNEAVFPFGAPDEDLLEGCSCRDVCVHDGQEEDGATSPCSCVRLNAAVQRWGEVRIYRRAFTSLADINTVVY